MLTLPNQEAPNWNQVVRKIIDETGFTQKELSEKTGVHKSTINILLAGDKKPQLSYVVGYQLVKAYHKYVIGSDFLEFKA